MSEVWKPITGYEDSYEISNQGKIRSKTRTRVVNNCHGGRSERSDKGKVMVPHDNGNGYLYITLMNDGKKKNFYVHRLVAEAFCEKEDRKDVVNHKDGNKKNNRAENLEWCTQKENVEYAVDEMMKPKRTCKPSNTGEKYISLKRDARGNLRYRVAIVRKGRRDVYKNFHTLEEAVCYRNGVMKYGELGMLVMRKKWQRRSPGSSPLAHFWWSKQKEIRKIRSGGSPVSQ